MDLVHCKELSFRNTGRSTDSMRSVSVTHLRNDDKLTEFVNCKGPSFTNQLLNYTCEIMHSLLEYISRELST